MRATMLTMVSVAALAAASIAGAGCGIREHGVAPVTDPGVPADPQEPPPGGTGGRGGAGGMRGGSGGTSGGGRDAAAPPPTSTVPGVDLGGVRVPRERAVVILHFGHSNMLGHGEEPESLRPHFFTTHPRLWSYRGSNNFVPASEPTSSTRSRDTAGPGMGLLRAAVMHAPEDYHFISIGLGVGSATTVDWSKGGLYYGNFMARANQLKGRVTFGAVAIMLGITDRHLPEAEQAGFADRVVKIAADIRADLGVADLPVLHTDYEVESTGTLALDGPVGQRFRPLILTLPMRIPNCAIVPTDMTGMEDDHHFNLAGHKLWADRAIQIWIDKKWAPWQ